MTGVYRSIMPDHSVIGRFVRQHEGSLTGEFFDQLTRQVLKVTDSGATIEAMSSRFQLIKEETLNQALAQAKNAVQVPPDDAAAAKRLHILEQAQAEVKSRQQKQAAKGKDPAKAQVQSNEAEAVLQPQKNSKDSHGSYKPTVLTTTPE